jgi:hypothetical protein
MHVEGLGLDTGRVHSRPFQVLLPQLGVRRLVGLLRHGLDGIGAIDGLLGAGYMSKPADNVSLGGSTREFGRGSAYCCCAHLSMMTDDEGVSYFGDECYESRRSAGYVVNGGTDSGL